MKVAILSDSVIGLTGYADQSRQLALGLLKRGFQVVSIGGSLNPGEQAYMFQGVIEYPVKFYGDTHSIRQIINHERPNVLLVNTDPRHAVHVFRLENEIRKICPLIFWHLWDAEPYPSFNEGFYDSCDKIVCGSKFVHDLLIENYYDKEKVTYIPMGVNTDVFKPLPLPERNQFKLEAEKGLGKPLGFTIGYVGRGIPRKRLLNMITILNEFAKDKDEPISLMLRTDPQDPEGVNLYEALKTFHPFTEKGNVVFVVPAESSDDHLNKIYNLFDVNLNISSAEGFCLPVVQSAAAEIPSIVSQTGGTKYTVTTDTGWSIPPLVKNIAYFNSPCPWIYDYFVSDEQVTSVLNEVYANQQQLKIKGQTARQFVTENYNITNTINQFENLFTKLSIEWDPTPHYYLEKV